MISIASAMHQDKIKEILTEYEGNFTYTFKEKKGIKLFFEVSGDPVEAANKAKELIKAEPWGNILYFQSIAV